MRDRIFKLGQYCLTHLVRISLKYILLHLEVTVSSHWKSLEVTSAPTSEDARLRRELRLSAPVGPGGSYGRERGLAAVRVDEDVPAHVVHPLSLDLGETVL